MIAQPQPSCHNRLKSLNSFSVGLLAGLLKEAIMLPMNVRIEVHSFDGTETPILLPQDENEMPRTLYAVLAGAIMRGLGGVQHLVGGSDPSLSSNRVRIMVFPR